MLYSFSSLDSNKNITVTGFVSNTSTTLVPNRQVLEFSKIPHTKEIFPVYKAAALPFTHG